MSTTPIILYDNEYCHVVDNSNGSLELVEGPCRIVLPSNKTIYKQKQKKIVLNDDQYIILCNPYDDEKKAHVDGKKRILRGPLTRSLFPEELMMGPFKALVLQENEGAVFMRIKNKLSKDKKQIEIQAGKRYVIKGPQRYFPSKNEKFIKKIQATQVSQNEAIYVRNTITGKLTTIMGPRNFLPEWDEELFTKELTENEYDALKIPREASWKAYQIQVQKGEAIAVIDYKTNQEKYILGPKGYILDVTEGLKVIDLSGGLPMRENVYQKVIVGLGPDFFVDQFQVRTKDNGLLTITISYKWKFIIDDEEKFKLFNGDFIGYACQSMRSRVREEVSRHEYEKFHVDSSSILREKLFKNYKKEVKRDGKTITEEFTGRFFSEFNFLIFQLDVNKINAVDKSIEDLLNESIKASMNIMVNKNSEQALVESKKNEIINQVEIEKMRENLIVSENQNFEREHYEKARIEGEERIEKTKAKMLATKMLQESELKIEIDNLKEKMKLFEDPKKGDIYIRYMKAKNFSEQVGKMTILPSKINTLMLPSPKSSKVSTLPLTEEEKDEN